MYYGKRSIDYWILGFLTGVIVLALYPVLFNGFVWDDSGNIENNLKFRGLTLTHMKWMFSTFYWGHYQPFAWLSFAFDNSIWGMNPFGYHLTNLLIHILNSIVFYFFIKLILIKIFFDISTSTKKEIPNIKFQITCLIGTLFFAINPMRVETVAWVTERRDVLSGLFFILTLYTYLKYHIDEKKNELIRRLSLLFFVCSLFSKVWGIVIPAVLLILDYYPLKRYECEQKSSKKILKLFIEKLPYILLCGIFLLLTILSQKVYGMKISAGHNFIERTIQSGYGLVMYPLKTIFPINLSPLYLLHHNFNAFQIKYLAGFLISVILTLFILFKSRRWPAVFAIWFSYGAIIFPMLGFAQGGEQIIADRYSYLSCLPFAITISALSFLFLKIESKKFSSTKILGVISLTVLLWFITRTNIQSRIWKNTFTLWSHAITIDPENYTAYNNRGTFFAEIGNPNFALSDYNNAIRFFPNNEDAYFNRASLYDSLKKFDRALSDYNSVIRIDPEFAEAYLNRGNIKLSLGNKMAAIKDYTEAIQVNPKYTMAYYNRGVLRHQTGDEKGAIEDFKKAMETAPPDWPQKNNVLKFLKAQEKKR